MKKYFIILISIIAFFVSCQNETEVIIDDAQITKFSSDTGKIANLTKEIIKDSKNPELYKKRAVALMEVNNVNDAISDLEVAIMLDTTNTEYLNLISDYWLIAGNSKPTKDYLDKSIALEPENTSTLVRLAKLHLFVGEITKSFEYANKAIKINPNLYTPYFVKSMCYLDMTDTSKAIRELLNSVAMNPDFYDGYQLLGVLASGQNDTLAISYLKIAQSINTQSIEAHYALGYFYQNQERFDDAITEYNYIINNIDSTYSRSYYNIGYINLVYQNNYKEAIKYFNLARNYEPNNPDIYYNIGRSYEKTGNKTKAKEYFEKALKLSPEHELSKKGLNRL
jgi:tetratricopeptide (TPR) repeat protein